MPPITTIQLDPVMRTEVAVATLLSAFHQVMNANEKGVVTDLDPEFLHDFRVAIRSSRALLTQARDVFPKRYLARFKSILAWLALATGSQRDLDVFLLSFEDYRAKLPHSVRDHLFPLRDFLLKCQWTEHRRLVRTLVSKRYLDFKRIYTEFLAGMATRRSRTAEGKRPVLQAASQAIWRAYRKATQEGQAITSDSPIEQLHELRKTCKKLRYLLEAFQTLYPRQKIRNVIKELKRLQDGLGALVDLDVQCQLLRRWEQAMKQEGQVPDETLQAMEMLDSMLAANEPTLRSSFGSHFDEFARPGNRRLFRKLFKDASR